jgi:Tat protein translocase TatB subunit
MFSLGFGEILLVGLIALIFIGPEQLPEVARVVARLLNEWKRATSELTGSLTQNLREDIKGRIEETRKENAALEAPPTPPPVAHVPIPENPEIPPHDPILEKKETNES